MATHSCSPTHVHVCKRDLYTREKRHFCFSLSLFAVAFSLSLVHPCTVMSIKETYIQYLQYIYINTHNTHLCNIFNTCIYIHTQYTPTISTIHTQSHTLHTQYTHTTHTIHTFAIFTTHRYVCTHNIRLQYLQYTHNHAHYTHNTHLFCTSGSKGM